MLPRRPVIEGVCAVRILRWEDGFQFVSSALKPSGSRGGGWGGGATRRFPCPLGDGSVRHAEHNTNTNTLLTASLNISHWCLLVDFATQPASHPHPKQKRKTEQDKTFKTRQEKNRGGMNEKQNKAMIHLHCSSNLTKSPQLKRLSCYPHILLYMHMNVWCRFSKE